MPEPLIHNPEALLPPQNPRTHEIPYSAPADLLSALNKTEGLSAVDFAHRREGRNHFISFRTEAATGIHSYAVADIDLLSDNPDAGLNALADHFSIVAIVPYREPSDHGMTIRLVCVASTNGSAGQGWHLTSREVDDETFKAHAEIDDQTIDTESLATVFRPFKYKGKKYLLVAERS